MKRSSRSRAARKTPRLRGAKPSAQSGVIAHVARAVEAVRQGEPIALLGDGSSLMLAVETARDAQLSALVKSGKASLLLTHARARTLKIRLYTPDIVALPLANNMRAENLRAIADPTEDLDFPLKGPFETSRTTLPKNYLAAVKLAKLAGLLPAVIVAPGAKRATVKISAADIFAYDEAVVESLTLVTRARVPLQGTEDAVFAAFRAGDGGPEHYAIVIGSPPTAKPVLARLHSECFTGDLLASLKCDCGSQLRGAIAGIEKASGGVLLYLAQEGRGIGLINKLRAYRLQDQGFDTMEANERLGFAADERLYAVAAKMLRLLGYKAVRLMTNNPAKVAALKAEGIKVTQRVPHSFPDNVHNRAYLKTKAERGGHLL